VFHVKHFQWLGCEWESRFFSSVDTGMEQWTISEQIRCHRAFRKDTWLRRRQCSPSRFRREFSSLRDEELVFGGLWAGINVSRETGQWVESVRRVMRSGSGLNRCSLGKIPAGLLELN
jgi:hypothetical protein